MNDPDIATDKDRYMSQLESEITVGKVLNSNEFLQTILPANTTCIDRGSPFENPYIIGVHGNRDEVCDLFDLDLARDEIMLENLDVLHGKNLLSVDAPHRSHGDTLVQLAALSLEDRLAWAENLKQRYGLNTAYAA